MNDCKHITISPRNCYGQPMPTAYLEKEYRVLGIELRDGGVYVFENCDKAYGAEYTKEEALAMLDELADFIKRDGANE